MVTVGSLSSTQGPDSQHRQAQDLRKLTLDHQQLGWGVAGLGETRVTFWGLGMLQPGLGVTSPHLSKLVALFKVCVSRVCGLYN